MDATLILSSDPANVESAVRFILSAPIGEVSATMDAIFENQLDNPEYYPTASRFVTCGRFPSEVLSDDMAEGAPEEITIGRCEYDWTWNDEIRFNTYTRELREHNESAELYWRRHMVAMLQAIRSLAYA